MKATRVGGSIRGQARLTCLLLLAGVMLARSPVCAQSAGAAAGAAPPGAVAADLEAAARLVGAPAGPRLSGDALAAATQRVAGLLRCPVCQGLSVADSPAPTAVNMRYQVRDLLAAGYVEAQILAYFERSYGEFVRLDPPARGVNWSLWLAPVVGLLLGALVVGWMLRAPRVPAPGMSSAPDSPEAAAASEAPVEDPLPRDADLARYVLRVRELAYGWPGGLRPGKDQR
jgi:cytochrome c-type biogenesis protein CcmH